MTRVPGTFLQIKPLLISGPSVACLPATDPEVTVLYPHMWMEPGFKICYCSYVIRFSHFPCLQFYSICLSTILKTGLKLPKHNTIHTTRHTRSRTPQVFCKMKHFVQNDTIMYKTPFLSPYDTHMVHKTGLYLNQLHTAVQNLNDF